MLDAACCMPDAGFARTVSRTRYHIGSLGPSLRFVLIQRFGASEPGGGGGGVWGGYGCVWGSHGRHMVRRTTRPTKPTRTTRVTATATRSVATTTAAATTTRHNPNRPTSQKSRDQQHVNNKMSLFYYHKKLQRLRLNTDISERIRLKFIYTNMIAAIKYGRH